ncbi:ATP-binding protein [Pseudoalteromonas sp. NZS71]|uniref:phosphoribosyltransferase-like protein n=1 Tax=unclassified Pseudoalteromonas TaxID=194690 RepID=UPI0004637304|nr:MULTISPECIES: ATP-binding protein [unclassified Pseudoalteromonas]MBH0061441.1 ATP-binding protein [Pseudoalteromonas sp. NZS71]
MNDFEATLAVERIINSITATSTDDSLKLARLGVRSILQEYSAVNLDTSLTLVETIQEISDNGASASLRHISILILRLTAVPHFFPKQTSGNNADAKIISLIEPKLSDFYKRFDINRQDQTYLKLDKLYEVHDFCCEKLKCLLNVHAKIETISAEKQLILKALGDNTVKSYFASYDYSRIRASVEAVLTQVLEFSKTNNNNFTRRLKDLRDLISDEIQYCDLYPTIITINYFRPFLCSIDEIIQSEAEKAYEQFKCEINSRKGNEFTLDKKYPLHKVNEEIRLVIPVHNVGPGMADRVIAHISCTNAELINEEIDLGSVSMGDFVIPLSFLLTEPQKEIFFEILITWNVIGQSSEEMYTLTVRVGSQSSNIDWQTIRDISPYNLDIAMGNDFYGRKDKIARLFSLIAAGKMQSSYITGQRRVGKSSLAKAYEEEIIKSHNDCFVLNIECGDFKYPSAVETVNALGHEIEEFLSQHLPIEAKWEAKEMNGSLAPISRLVTQLERFAPKKRFLIIIDEFDEINQDLYRYSEIAETFFLNLRAISRKRNICFCLIGAERMSFVMSSQGEKLNKFTREPIDKFNQETEWQDYEALIKANIGESITWLDNAIRRIYYYSNGHPYFTKQICSKVFDNAVISKDSEISDAEVETAILKLIPELDVNAFQHFWRDGISSDLDEIEIITIKRCRVLVGYARAKRLNLDANVEHIKSQVYSGQIQEAEILPILSDFCRRGIMEELNSEYKIIIPLFERWLVNHGFNSLIADKLGDELAERRQIEEDDAYIQDEEIHSLLDLWPDYRGIKFSNHIIRDWLSQVPSHIHQRLLFKLLKHTRFYKESEIRSSLKDLHNKVRRKLDVVVQKSKSQRRKDIWITYVDGAGKSGSQFAACYAEENLISSTCVKDITEIDHILQKKLAVPEEISTILIVDDFIGSGTSLSENIKSFYQRNGSVLHDANTTILLGVVCATTKGEDKVRKVLTDLDENSDLIVCETISNTHYAFNEHNTIWENNEEMLQAKELCMRLGSEIDKQRPLGYEEQGLLVVFSRNCPNNSLPVLHSSGRGNNQWKPLFERVKH